MLEFYSGFGHQQFYAEVRLVYHLRLIPKLHRVAVHVQRIGIHL